MNLINSSVYHLDEPNPLKKIEVAGRTCYKSDSEFTDETAIKFFDRMSNSGHYAMLEHGEATFELLGMKEGELDSEFRAIPYIRTSYKPNRWYVTMTCSHMVGPNVVYSNISKLAKELFFRMRDMFLTYYLNGMNDKVLVTQINGIQIKMLKDVTEIVDFNEADLKLHKSETFKFIVDRAVSHELVRHRQSVAQESQRYCNYSKNKFGNEITFVTPHDWDTWSDEERSIFEFSLVESEKNYMKLINLGKLPQDARRVLPNATKTEVILTMPIGRWEHFINLRSKGTTGAPHPDMKRVADPVAIKIPEIIEDYMSRPHN